MPEGFPGSYVESISADGGTIVGELHEVDASIGDVHLRAASTLLGGIGEDLASWVLDSASAVSADGRRIVGSGLRGNTNRGFLARLPAAASEPGNAEGADAGGDAASAGGDAASAP